MAIPTLWWSALGIQNVPMMTPDIQGQPLTEVKPKTIATWKPITLPKKLPATGGKMNVEEFAQKIKAKYPQYESLDNADLAKKMIDKYPQYGEQVDMTTFGKISEVTPMQWGIRRWVAWNASLEWTMLEWLEPVNKQLDRVNLVWRFTQFIDDNVQKIPTISRESMAQALKWTPFEWMEVLPTMVANAPGSLLKTATATARGITNPFDTIIGLSKLALTEEWRQAIIDRYGSIEWLKKTMTEDPVGLASDALTLVQWWAWLASKWAKIAWMTDTASKLWNISNVAWWAADLWLSTVIPQWLQKASQFWNEMWQKWLLWTVGNTVIKWLVEPTQPLQAIKWLIPDTTKARNYAAEKLMNSKLKITKTNKDAVRKASWIEPSQYILENDLWWNTIDDIVANTQDFVDRSMATKLQALETVKTPQEITSRERLIGNSIISQAKNDISEVYWKPFDDILPDEIVPELQDQFNMIQNVDNLIKWTEALPIQLEAMKSLYDSYNSHLKYDPSKKRILSSAEKIRLWLQSNIEWIGKEVWVDIKRLNKNIAWGKALEKWLIQSMDRADNNNIFWLSDTQTALISSVLWWSPVDVALTLWWKSILENVWVRSNIAKSLYTKQFDEQRLVSKDSIVGSDNTAGGNISRQFANSNTSVNSSKSSDINQPSQTLPTKTKAPLVQSTKTAPKLPVATKTPLKQANRK